MLGTKSAGEVWTETGTIVVVRSLCASSVEGRLIFVGRICWLRTLGLWTLGVIAILLHSVNA